MENTIERKLREFITTQFLFGDASVSLGDQDSLLEKGIMDSTGVVQLVSFIEETFGICIEDEALVPENLDTIRRINDFILREKETQGRQ